ncbi:MAG: AAA family ATPase [Oscillospiraceae bacterium]|nr:AAA family ATPase [Oscillospiraceae bacterium]
MINPNKIVSVIEGYKQYFPEHWENEKYKWEAVKHFQDNWDIEAENFGTMFKKATDKTFNLLASGYAYPRGMILEFAKADDNAVREMFRRLFDESLALSDRVTEFMNTAEELRIKYNDGTWKQHYQNTNYISTYLWLMYPDKYYIYKYELFKKCAEVLDDTYRPKSNGAVDNVIGGYRMYDEIRKTLQADGEIRQMLQAALTGSCFPDPELVTTTIDFGFYIARFYLDDAEKAATFEEDWFPSHEEYDPQLSVEDWRALLEDPEVFDEKSLDVIKAFYDVGGQATCKELSNKYGKEANYYNSVSSGLAQRIHKKTNCPIMDRDNKEDFRWWSILYIGKKAGKDQPGAWVWKLRDELKIALDAISESHDRNVDAIKKNEAFPLFETYNKNDFLNDVFLTAQEYDKLRSLVLRKKNIILQGALGVGKTFSAKRLAYSIIGEKNENRICMVQFHQNYSYEDFIMGYRPNDGGGFELQSGVFYNFCIRCKENPDKPYFFIIDEINRGNLSKIFGELLMLIETDKRGEKHKLNLVYGGTAFYIPENLHIIGMMNTADRSLAMIDYALRRRFSFYTMQPAFENADQNGFADYTADIQCKLYHSVIAKIKELNDTIRKDSTLGKGFEIGHSYFAPENKSEINDEWVRGVVEYEIIPLIEEYWFDDDKKVDEWTKALYQALGDRYDR